MNQHGFQVESGCTEVGSSGTSMKVLQHPFHECYAEGCNKPIRNDDYFYAGLSGMGQHSFLCSMKCVDKFLPDFFELQTCYFEPTKCGFIGCRDKLKFGGSYYSVFGSSSLCCSEECADNQYNLVWREESDWRETLYRVGWDTDQQNIKDDIYKFRC